MNVSNLMERNLCVYKDNEGVPITSLLKSIKNVD